MVGGNKVLSEVKWQKGKLEIFDAKWFALVLKTGDFSKFQPFSLKEHVALDIFARIYMSDLESKKGKTDACANKTCAEFKDMWFQQIFDTKTLYFWVDLTRNPKRVRLIS